jgi:transposase
MSQSRTLYIGWDVHKASIAVAYAPTDPRAAVIYLGAIGTRQCDLDKLIRHLQAKATRLAFVYEAGPCGSWLYRSLTKKDDACRVVAPSLMPKTAGARVNTDRRDAVPLARAETLSDCKDATLRLHAFVLRHDIRSTGRANWNLAPLRGRSEVGCPTPAQHSVLQEYVRAVTAHPTRLQRLAQAHPEHVKAWRVPPGGEALQALRGVQCTVAVTRVAEMGALRRFDTPRALMQVWGVLPAEYSSGDRRQQGAITTAGKPHARRALVAGAWASRYPAKVSHHLQVRREKPPTVLQDIRWKAHVRLCQRYRHLGARGQQAHLVTVAIARQLPVAAYGSRTDRHCLHNAAGCRRASEEAPPRWGGTLGSVQRLGQAPRAERAAGTRRRQGRGEPPHGEPQAHPSPIAGSASSEARRVKKTGRPKKVC